MTWSINISIQSLATQMWLIIGFDLYSLSAFPVTMAEYYDSGLESESFVPCVRQEVIQEVFCP